MSVPEGALGAWRVERFTVSPEEARYGRLRASLGHPREWIEAGEYTRLTRGGSVVMSDTPAEWSDLRRVIRECEGAERVLIHGLGLGLLLTALRCRVDVVEIDRDVVRLVGPHYRKLLGDRLSLVVGDAMTWKPPRGMKWDVVYHDIWDVVSGANLPQIKVLHRRFAKRARWWQGSWAEAEVRRLDWAERSL